jgi:hypothetical protein
MAGMGPPPKTDGTRRRRNASIAMTRLPAEGRTGDPPPFPLPLLRGPGGRPLKTANAREGELWAQLWATPQAVAWERRRWTHEVAMYVRWTAAAELGSLDAGKEARQLADRLGLTDLAMLRLRWEIADDEVGEKRTERAATTRRRRAGAQQRLKVVDPDAVAGG